MRILSIHDGHNASAGYFKDGEMKYAIQEERINKIKNYMGFPKNSVKQIFEKFNLSSSNIDFIVFNGNYMVAPFDIKQLKIRFKKHFQNTFYSVNWWKIKNIVSKTPIGNYFLIKKKDERIKPILKFGFKKTQIKFVDHHLAHASSAYFGSPWWNTEKNVLILTLDGGGDNLCATVSIGEKGKITKISETLDTNSIGNIYSRVTFMLGFTPWEHEYKLMGMAPYVKKEYSKDIYDIFNNYICIDSQDNLKFKKKIFEPTSFIYNRMKNDFQFQRFDTICRGLQDFTEDIIVKWVKAVIKKTDVHTLALSGGVFMNVKVNKRIMEIPEVKELFIFPSCGDETNIFGATWNFYINNQLKQNEKLDLKPFGHLYLGTEIINNNVEKEFKNFSKKHKIEYEYRNDITQFIGELISEDKIVARATGPMEFGARALGNRSILSNASNLKNVQTINMMIKKRDFWMPFAPVILKERYKNYIINPKKIPSPYMILSFDTTEKRDDIIGAVQQADFTARPQIIEKSWNKDYYNIVKTFEKETGFGGMMNTSFNLHGYPIVNDVKDALWVFENSGLEYLNIGNFLIKKLN